MVSIDSGKIFTKNDLCCQYIIFVGATLAKRVVRDYSKTGEIVKGTSVFMAMHSSATI